MGTVAVKGASPSGAGDLLEVDFIAYDAQGHLASIPEGQDLGAQAGPAARRRCSQMIPPRWALAARRSCFVESSEL
jgi:hypothetical protein